MLPRLTFSSLPDTHSSSPPCSFPLHRLLCAHAFHTCFLHPSAYAPLYSLPSWLCVPLSWSWVCPCEGVCGWACAICLACLPCVHTSKLIHALSLCALMVPCVPSSFCTLKSFCSSNRVVHTHPGHCYALFPNSCLVWLPTSSLCHTWFPLALCSLSFALMDHPRSTLKIVLSQECSLWFCVFLGERKEKKWGQVWGAASSGYSVRILTKGRHP